MEKVTWAMGNINWVSGDDTRVPTEEFQAVDQSITLSVACFAFHRNGSGGNKDMESNVLSPCGRG
jgi:hypothetical protein